MSDRAYTHISYEEPIDETQRVDQLSKRLEALGLDPLSSDDSDSDEDGALTEAKRRREKVRERAREQRRKEWEEKPELHEQGVQTAGEDNPEATDDPSSLILPSSAYPRSQSLALYSPYDNRHDVKLWFELQSAYVELSAKIDTLFHEGVRDKARDREMARALRKAEESSRGGFFSEEDKQAVSDWIAARNQEDLLKEVRSSQCVIEGMTKASDLYKSIETTYEKAPFTFGLIQSLMAYDSMPTEYDLRTLEQRLQREKRQPKEGDSASVDPESTTQKAEQQAPSELEIPPDEPDPRIVFARETALENGWLIAEASQKDPDEEVYLLPIPEELDAPPPPKHAQERTRRDYHESSRSAAEYSRKAKSAYSAEEDSDDVQYGRNWDRSRPSSRQGTRCGTPSDGESFIEDYGKYDKYDNVPRETSGKSPRTHGSPYSHNETERTLLQRLFDRSAQSSVGSRGRGHSSRDYAYESRRPSQRC